MEKHLRDTQMVRISSKPLIIELSFCRAYNIERKDMKGHQKQQKLHKCSSGEFWEIGLKGVGCGWYTQSGIRDLSSVA